MEKLETHLLQFLRCLWLVGMLVMQACSPSSTTAGPKAVDSNPAADLSATRPNPTATSSGIYPGQVKIAVLAPLTGVLSSFGQSTRNGVQIAIDEWNVKGGAAGLKIVPVFADSACSANQAAAAANQVINQDQVHYIVGEVCSSASIAISEIAQARGVVQISPVSTVDPFTLNPDGSTKKYVFRACYTDSFQGSITGKFALENLRASKAFILSNPANGYTTGLANAFRKTFTGGGGQIVGDETYTYQETDFSVIFSKIAKAGPDIIFLGDSFDVVNQVTAQAKQQGITVPFIGADGWDSPDLNRTTADGSYFSTHFSPQDQRPAAQDWVKKYQMRYQTTPDALATLGYDATNLLLAALARTGKDDPQIVAAQLAALQWDGVSGTISFDAQHNPIKPAVIMQVKNGQINYVATIQP